MTPIQLAGTADSELFWQSGCEDSWMESPVVLDSGLVVLAEAYECEP